MSATGSAGTIAAGDHLKARHGTKIAAVEAIECPTMLCNGYGEHNIQGIGDKHIPLIHNVMNTDLVVGVSDLASDSLNLLFGGNVGRSYMVGRHEWTGKSVQTRVYTTVLAAAQVLYEKHGAAADPWMTTVGYFNALRELGGMRRMVDDEVANRAPPHRPPRPRQPLPERERRRRADLADQLERHPRHARPARRPVHRHQAGEG